jgi:hypothetical protein
MECQYCKNTFSNKQNLNAHQTKTKYCLKIQNKQISHEHKCSSCEKKFSSTTTLRRHQKTCSSKELIITLTSRITELECTNTSKNGVIKELRTFISGLQERYDNLSITAVKRPTMSTKNVQINNYIKNMTPLLETDLTSNVDNLTLDYHVKGIEGYAEYALGFPFKDKIVCVDMARNKIKYKNEDGDLIEDIGFKKMMAKLCCALKDRSFSLSQEHYEKLSHNFSDSEMDEVNFMETAMAITKCANGKETDFCDKIVSIISKGSHIRCG